eukprot:jgi/Mesvir1/13384/Mv15053-RA.1
MRALLGARFRLAAHVASQRLATGYKLEDAVLRQGLPAAALAGLRMFSSGGFASVVDARLASYGVENPMYAIIQLAQTTMRSELGKITLDKTFEERDTLNTNIVRVINDAAKDWGIQCMRYEIRDITPPPNVKKAMEMQAAAERQKRAEVLASEGKQQSSINIAEGQKRSVILASEAARIDFSNRATGEAEAIVAKAEATARGLLAVSNILSSQGGAQAASLRVAEQYVAAFSNIAKEGNTILLPSHASDPAAMVAQALAIFKSMSEKGQSVPPGKPTSPATGADGDRGDGGAEQGQGSGASSLLPSHSPTGASDAGSHSASDVGGGRPGFGAETQQLPSSGLRSSSQGFRASSPEGGYNWQGAEQGEFRLAPGFSLQRKM